jgi:hypothetical protein
MAGLQLSLCSISTAKKFVSMTHRRLRKVVGARFAVGIENNGKLVGVAIVGRPPSRHWNEDTLCVSRVAVEEGNKNACSMLYGACSRAARAIGAKNLVTYTHIDEPGTSLKAAGWVHGGLTSGGEWDRNGRRRQEALFPEQKNRWFAPWSERVKEKGNSI